MVDDEANPGIYKFVAVDPEAGRRVYSPKQDLENSTDIYLADVAAGITILVIVLVIIVLCLWGSVDAIDDPMSRRPR